MDLDILGMRFPAVVRMTLGSFRSWTNDKVVENVLVTEMFEFDIRDIAYRQGHDDMLRLVEGIVAPRMDRNKLGARRLRTS